VPCGSVSINKVLYPFSSKLDPKFELKVVFPQPPFGFKIPMSRRIQTLLEHYFAVNNKWFIGPRQVQKILGHDRLSTTAVYLNLTNTHILDEYSQKW
jgi:hypothetical protein